MEPFVLFLSLTALAQEPSERREFRISHGNDGLALGGDDFGRSFLNRVEFNSFETTNAEGQQKNLSESSLALQNEFFSSPRPWPTFTPGTTGPGGGNTGTGGGFGGGAGSRVMSSNVFGGPGVLDLSQKNYLERFELSWRMRDWGSALPSDVLKTFVEAEMALVHYSSSPSVSGTDLEKTLTQGDRTFASNGLRYHRTCGVGEIRIGGRADYGIVSLEGMLGYGTETSALDRSFFEGKCELTLHSLEDTLLDQRRPRFAAVAGASAEHFFNGENQVDFYAGVRTNFGVLTGEILGGVRASVNDDLLKGLDRSETDGDTFVTATMGFAF